MEMNEERMTADAPEQASAPPRQAQATSLIDRQSRFNGTYQALQNLRIEGAASGEIDCRGTLIVAESAVVNAKVNVRDIRIAGELQGEVDCAGRFELMPTARVNATVRARQVVVHEGAVYNGELTMVTEETQRQAPERRADARPPVVQESSAEEAPRMERAELAAEADDRQLEKLPDASEFGRRLSEVLESRPATRRRS
jgi:cytoskeletal protein CcmA (bactofilin family)